MTRINLVPPEELSGKHLVAEYRELPRVFSIARKRGKQGGHLPQSYTLGKGHVLFFTDKLLFLLIRYQALIDEMRARNYNAKPVPLDDLVRGIPASMFNGYRPTKEALKVNRQRIKERS